MNRTWVRRATTRIAVVSLLTMLSGFLLGSAPAHAISPNVVISQVYGGGGGPGTVYTHDFVELHNRGVAPVSVAGWTLQYASATQATWSAVVLGGTIQPGAYYLVRLGSGGGGTTPLPTPDASDNTIFLNEVSGKVALVNNSTLLSGTCPPSPNIVDMFGYGVANCFEGTVASALSFTTAALRLNDGCTETDNNLADFAAGAPSPRNSASTAVPCQHTLTYLSDLNGTISGTTPQVVAHGGSGTPVTAVPNSGYHFVDWSDGVLTASRTDNPVLADLTVTARFAPDDHTLTYLADPNGTISGTTPQTVAHGASGTEVTAVPNTGYHFVDWSDGVLTASRTDNPVLADLTVTANFAINVYALTYTAGANGSITGTSPQNVPHGGSGTEVTAVPDAGYHFVDWSDGVLTASRTDNPVLADVNVTANFAINVYTLTYTAGANGSITGTSPQNVPHGGSGTEVTAVPNAGHHFVGWSDGVLTASRTDNPVLADLTVTASFEINSYTLTYTAGANGSIAGTSPQTVAHGADGTQVEAVPNTGYHFLSWSDGYPTAIRTDTNVQGNISVTANFEINSYTLTYNAGPNGSITGTTPQIVQHGSNGTAVTAVPNAGYYFVKWSDDVATATRQDLNVTADLTVTAIIAEKLVVVSQVFGGGDEPGAPFTHDYIELFNRGDFPLDLTGWSVQYATATSSTWTLTQLEGTIAAHGYFLVQLAGSVGLVNPLPTPDDIGSINMSATAGKVALVSNATALSGTCPTGGAIEDFVGYGAANCSETSPAPGLTNTTAALRDFDGCTDTDNNSADFTAGTPNPRNSASPLNTCTFTLTVIIAPSPVGTVTRSPDQSGYAPGTVVHIQAFPNPGYHFDHWTGGATGTTNPASVTMNSDVTVTAHFVSNDNAGQLVISQVYGAGGDEPGGYANDYVELFNRGSAAVNVTGWSIQHAQGSTAVWNREVLTGTIQPGKYYLIQLRAGASGGSALPGPDAFGGMDVSPTSGKVALVSNSTLLVGGCPTGAEIIDFLGYGDTDCSETAPHVALTGQLAAHRKFEGCYESDDNSDDFQNAATNPRYSGTPANFCEPWLDAPQRTVQLALHAPSPNPSRGISRITFGLPTESRVKLTVSDVMGRRVAMLVDGMLPAGPHDVTWKGVGESGPVRSGLYYVALEVEGRRMVKALAIVR